MTPAASSITERETDVARIPSRQPTASSARTSGSTRCSWSTARDHLRGLVTASDVERITGEAKSRRKPARDSQFRLVAGAALFAKRNARRRPRPGGHPLPCRRTSSTSTSTRWRSRPPTATPSGVGEIVKLVRGAFPSLTIIAGNVTSAAGVEFLADCGADAVKVGQGPGSICTTRIVAGVGIPQLTALFVASRRRRRRGVRILADGGHHQVGRHRQGAHAFGRRRLRRRPGRLPGGAGRDHGNRRKGL